LRPRVNTKKHIVQISQSTVSQAAKVTTVLAVAIEGAPSTPTQTKEGAIVSACYVEFWVSQDSATVVGSYTVVLEKVPGVGGTITTGQMAALHDYDNKKNIFFTGQGLLTPNDGGQVPVLRGWYKIPKSKQRFGLGDTLSVSLRNNNATALDLNFCGLAVFKEQY